MSSHAGAFSSVGPLKCSENQAPRVSFDLALCFQNKSVISRVSAEVNRPQYCEQSILQEISVTVYSGLLFEGIDLIPKYNANLEACNAFCELLGWALKMCPWAQQQI